MNSLIKVSLFMYAVPLSRVQAEQFPVVCRQTDQDVLDVYYRTFRPGTYLSSDGWSAVVNRREEVQNVWGSPTEIDSQLKDLILLCTQNAQETNPEYWRDIQKQTNKEPYFCRTEDFEMSIGNNPKEKENFQKASEYCRKEWVEKETFWTLPTDEMISEIKKIHEMLFQEMTLEDGAVAGEFRQGNSVILDGVHSFYEMLEMGWDRLSSKEQRTMRALLKDRVRFNRLSEKDRAVVQKIVPVNPSWKKVDKLMMKFVEDLKKMKEDGVDSVSVAAFAHNELGKIHPFGDGNGRVARILMNTILAQDGYQPVSFKNNALYTKHTSESVDSFEQYLREEISQTCESS